MAINWEAVFENELRQFEKMSEAEKYMYALLLQFGSPYRWGKENPAGADCSGSVCLALYMATGLLIRTTADDLYQRFFTIPKPNKGSIRAAFFLDRTGKATHVAALVGEDVVLNAQEPGARVRRLGDIADWFHTRGLSTAVRGLDYTMLERAARNERFEIDAELLAMSN